MGDMRTLIDVLRTDTSSPVARCRRTGHRGLAHRGRTRIRHIHHPDRRRSCDDHPGPLVSVTAYNALREALVNAEKHARAGM
ncbi:hypothetical protein [Acidipropionibacterium acidipropionici]|uniref:hypothetical protein n=1 Tax=Acidipropionibacterium acidipropionici TaxID=1748 RepID=UPI000AB5F69D|nr:hypothetical protein [Acidipropionibacterium acidipropionici]